MIKYLKSFRNKLRRIRKYILSKTVKAHEKLRNDGWYKFIGFEFSSVLLTGFLISIALIPFLGTWKPWLAISYGLIPWVFIQLLVYAKDKLLR